MQNLFWYICLAFIGVVSVSYTIFKSKDIYKVSTLLVFYLYISGFTWICEFIVLGVFNSYSYKTGFFVDVWKQNLLGHLMLNTTLYPAASIVVVTHSRKYIWIAFFSAFFTFMDYLCVNAGVYQHNWWRYYMTTITVIILLLIANKWFVKMNHGCYGLTRAITFYFVAMIIIHTPAPILMLMGKQYYYVSLINNLFGNLYRTSIAIIFFYHLIEAFLLVVFTCILKKWYWITLPFIISIVCQSIFFKMGILVLKDRWNLIYILFIYEIFIASFIIIEKHTLKPDLNKLK